MKKIKWILLLSMLALVIVIGACSGSADETEKPSAAGDSEPAEIETPPTPVVVYVERGPGDMSV